MRTLLAEARRGRIFPATDQVPPLRDAESLEGREPLTGTPPSVDEGIDAWKREKEPDGAGRGLTASNIASSTV